MADEIASRPVKSNGSGMRGTAGTRALEERFAALDRDAGIVLERCDLAVDDLRECEVRAHAELGLQVGDGVATAMDRLRDVFNRHGYIRARLGMIVLLLLMRVGAH